MRRRGLHVSVRQLTMRMWSSKIFATIVDILWALSCAMRVRFVIMGFELKVRWARWPRNMASKAAELAIGVS